MAGHVDDAQIRTVLIRKDESLRAGISSANQRSKERGGGTGGKTVQHTTKKSLLCALASGDCPRTTDHIGLTLRFFATYDCDIFAATALSNKCLTPFISIDF
jgi:hypothetical protein